MAVLNFRYFMVVEVDLSFSMVFGASAAEHRRSEVLCTVRTFVLRVYKLITVLLDLRRMRSEHLSCSQLVSLEPLALREGELRGMPSPGMIRFCSPVDRVRFYTQLGIVYWDIAIVSFVLAVANADDRPGSARRPLLCPEPGTERRRGRLPI